MKTAPSARHKAKKKISKTRSAGVRIYHQPSFLVQRSPTRRFFCRDSTGRIVAEFVGMNRLTEYVAEQTGKSKNYIKQKVYKTLNKNINFLGYHWTDK